MADQVNELPRGWSRLMSTDPESLSDAATELDPIDNLYDENQRLLTEVETLKDSLVMEPQRYPGELGVLRAEIGRLRAALKEIADGIHPLEMVRVAQAALAPQPRP